MIAPADLGHHDAEQRRVLLTDLAAVERLRAAFGDQETAERTMRR